MRRDRWQESVFVWAIWIIAFAVAIKWPEHDVSVFLLAGSIVGMLFFFKLRQPHNYESIQICTDGVTYVSSGKETTYIKWDDILSIEIFRESDCGFPETTWVIGTKTGTKILVPDEWPDGKRLIKAFQLNVPAFDNKLAMQALTSKEEGSWKCT